MKSALRPARRPKQARPPAELPADPAAAAAALLPALDAAAATGDVASGQAAMLLRRLAAPRPCAPEPPPLAELVAAIERLLRVVRQQDAHIGRLHAMLDSLL